MTQENRFQPCPEPLSWGYTLQDALKWYREAISSAKSSKECLQVRALVASAPVLLKACELALDDLFDTVNYEEGDERTLATVSALEEAIALAKGQS